MARCWRRSRAAMPRISTAPRRRPRWPSSPGATCRRRCARNCCIASPTPSRTAPTTSRCWNASTPARRTASWPRPRSAAAENFRFFADKCAEARDGLNTPSEEHWNISTRVPIGPVGVITPWNTPFMLSTWKIAPALAAGCTVVHKPAEWSPVTADLLAKLGEAGRPARRRAQHRARHRRGSRQGADRASRDQGDRLRRRKRDRLGDHGAGRADPEARAFRTRRQEPGDRVRRRRSRPRARCGRVHDLLAQRRALHLVEPAAGPARHRREIHRKADRAGEGAEGRPSARSRDRNRAADPRAASGKGLLLFRRRAEGRRHHRRRRQAA